MREEGWTVRRNRPHQTISVIQRERGSMRGQRHSRGQGSDWQTVSLVVIGAQPTTKPVEKVLNACPIVVGACPTPPPPIPPHLTNIHICDRLRENPAYGINTQVVQCAFLVHQVKNCQTSDFVISMSNNPSTNCYRRLRRLNVSY